jgi:short-subunit dehydrogenase
MELAWKVNVQGLVAWTQLLTPSFTKRAQGNIIVIGATASLRGGANFCAFASAKGAQKNLTESIGETRMRHSTTFERNIDLN